MMVPQIAEMIVRLATATAADSLGRADPASYAPYTAAAIANRYAVIFDGLCAARAEAAA
jgi:hypothetical protein